ncbi:MAG: hypothetical protein PHS41_09045 [Victivallaceae bacterium]|nr:hypothetical protein [Victivallaceae bacterium]
MKHKLAMLAAALLALTGCTVIPPEDPVGTKSPETQSRELAAAQHTGRQMLQAFLDDNAKGFCAGLDKTTAEKFSQSEFKLSRERMVREYGKPLGFTYLGDLANPLLKVLVWKVRFEKIGSKNQPIHRELLFQLTSGVDENNRCTVISFGFL